MKPFPPDPPDQRETRLSTNDSATLLDQIVEAFTQQIRDGKTPSIREYQEAYPHLHDEIEELLSSVALIEGLKPSRASLAGTSPAGMNQIAHLEQLGDYRIVRELGRGGMGVVLEAIHESLGRRVAIKVLPPHWTHNAKYAERFRREAQAAATLHHTNIVSVFGSFESDGYHYFVMEYVDGWGLDKVLQAASTTATSSKSASTEPSFGSETQSESRPMFSIPAGKERFTWAASLASQIADALQHAHEQSKLHRDLKPSNLILDHRGRIWLTDFGLVKNMTRPGVTESGELVGTPRYMAPESFSGTYDARSETYCLGLTLYELLTLQPAYAEASTPELIKNITSTSPRPAHQVTPQLPRDLDTIVMKAIEREPARRYQTAEAFRDDLLAFLDQRPIQARRASLPERTWLWCRRNPWASLTALLLLMVAIVASGASVITWQAWRVASRAKHRAENNAQQFKIQYERAEENFARAEANFQRAESNVDLALEMFDEMFKQLVLRGSAQRDHFAFDDFEELSGIETTVSDADAEYLEAMMTFFQRFGEQNSNNQALQIQAAQAFRRVANIYHLVGQYPQAIEAYQQSLSLQEQIASLQPPSTEQRVDQIRTRNEMGLAILQSGQLKNAEKTLMKTIREVESLDSPLALDLQYELVRTLNLRGSLAPIESPETFSEVLDRSQPTAAPDAPSQPQRQRRLEQRWQKRMKRQHRQNAKQVAFLQRAIELADALIEIEPANPNYHLEKAKSYVRLAELESWSEQPESSEQARQTAIEILEQLVQQHPTQPQFRAVLAQVYALSFGRPAAQQRAQLQQAQAISRELTEQSPRNIEYLQLDAKIHFQLGQLDREKKRTLPALKNYRRALEQLNLVVEVTHRNQWIQMRRLLVAVELAELLIETNRHEEARDMMVPIEKQISQQRNRFRNRDIVRSLTIYFYETLISVHQHLGDRQAARQTRQKLKRFRSSKPNGRSKGRSSDKK